jgi:hypothetical protein
VFALGAEPLVIGRDVSVQVMVDHPRVSRLHARIWPSGSGYALCDLGSSNGTFVNDEKLCEARLLCSGDRIDVGGGVAFVYELQRPWLSRATLVCVGSLLAAALAAALLAGGRRAEDPLMSEAGALARAGLEAYERRDWHAAVARLSAAVGLLYDAGRLDDTPRLRRPDEGLRRIAAGIGTGQDLSAVYRRASEASRPPAPAPPSREPCRLDRVPAGDLRVCIRERAEAVLAAVWQQPDEVPESFFRAVEGQLLLLCRERREWLEAAIERGKPLSEMMARELEAEHMPPALRYLALIESGYQSGARSSAGAAGLWQFMPATARAYGLRVDASRDERADQRKSTRAAARHLNALAFEFGGDALLLAIAAYNKGENGVRAALRKLRNPRTERSYWRLVEQKLLPAETEDYVPRFVAAAVVSEAGIPTSQVLGAARAGERPEPGL